MSHIIIEGPDGAGKTALALTLCKSLSMGYHHEGPPPANIDRYGHYMSVLRSFEQSTVIDRFHLGEAIYGPLLRGGSGLAPAQIIAINQKIIREGGRIIVCLPPWEICLENNRRKWNQELIQSEIMLRAAYDAWSVLVRNTELFVGRIYDYAAQ